MVSFPNLFVTSPIPKVTSLRRGTRKHFCVDMGGASFFSQQIHPPLIKHGKSESPFFFIGKNNGFIGKKHGFLVDFPEKNQSNDCNDCNHFPMTTI